jgi:hypothetical protein
MTRPLLRLLTLKSALPTLCVLLMASAGASTGQERHEALPCENSHGKPFLTVRGASLLMDKRQSRNVGANMPDLFELFLHDRDAAAEKALGEAQTAGIRFVRCFGSTWGPADFHLFVDDRVRWLAAYDRMLTAADRHAIALVPSILFNAHMIPDYLKLRSPTAAKLLCGSKWNAGRAEQVTAPTD